MWTQPHLLDLARLSRAEIEHLLLEARGLGAGPIASSALAGHTVATLFFEPSTRTRSSFEIAATRLGATVLNLNLATSSTSKGETLLDTVANVQAMGVSALVVRHPVSGTPELIAKQCAASVINAGDGRHEHPTQGLLDALTILEKKGRIEGLVVTLAGDILNSRVARSNIHLLGKFGARVRLVAPRTLLPRDIEKMGSHLTVHDRFDEALTDADVVMMLRVQSERLNEASFPSRAEYHRLFGLTEARMKLAKPDAIVMHPGPMNRGVEIASAVADGPQSVILEQVKLGVRVRMAVLSGVISANGALSGSRTKSAGGHE